MSLKLFSAYHEGGHGKDTVRFFEKKSEGQSLWLLSLLPIPKEKGTSVVERLEQMFEEALFSISEHSEAEDHFENALKRANDILGEEMGHDMENLLRSGSMLLGFLSDGELLLSAFGQGEVFLLRDGVLTEISEGLSPSTAGQELFQNVSSGDLQDGDHLIFSTLRLQRYLTERQLSGILADGVTESKETIATALDPSEEGNLFLIHVKAMKSLSFSSSHENDSQLEFPTRFGENSFDNLLMTVKDFFRNLPIQKTHILLGLASLMGIFLIFLFFQMVSGQEKEVVDTKYTEFVTDIEKDLSVVDRYVLEDKVDQANVKLNDMEKTAQEMLVDRVNITNAEKILALIDKKRQEVNRIMKIDNPTRMADLTSVNPDISARGLFFFDNELLIYDEDFLYRVLTSDITPEELEPITSSDEVLFGVPFSGKDRSVFVTRGGNVLEWQDGQIVSADTADETWKTPTDIATYSKYLYFLDAENAEIWKYERRDAGFTQSEEWLKEDIDLTQAVSFSIDGGIFVLTKGGEILKFYQGQKQDYEISGAPEGSVMGDILYTDEDSDRLFVLDKQEGRITVLHKGENVAEYEQQIILGNTGPILDLYVEGNIIYVLGEQEVYEVKL